MIFRLRLFESIFHMKRSFFQLRQAESIYGLYPRICILFFISIIIFSASGAFGIGTQVFSSDLVMESENVFRGMQVYFVLGRFILGVLYAAFIIFFQALWFWTLTDAPYKKLVILQVFIFPLLLLEQCIHLLLAVKFSLPWFSSPFSFGPIAQYLTDNQFIIYLLGSMTLFKFVIIAIQLYGLRTLCSRQALSSLTIVLGIHIIFWLGRSFLAFFNFKMIL